jgi:transcriptional regulator with XRE-family HTH domain
MKTDLTIENINTSSMLGVALKRHRKQVGISQDELAKVVNMRQATISDLENGRGTLDSFFKVIQVLKVNVVFSNQKTLQKRAGKTKAKMIIDLLDD